MNELERVLVEVGRHLDVPDTPDLASGVRSRLERRTVPRVRRRVALAVALGVATALTATLAISDARSALLRVLRIGGARIELVDELPPVPARGVGPTLGERVALPEARARAGFALRELDDAPTAAYLGDRGTVWLVYGEVDRPRLLLAQTPGYRIGEEVHFKKLLAAGSYIETVSVEGSPAVFVSGEPHLILFLDEFGEPVEETARLARDVLVWEEDGVAFRLEGDLTPERAVQIAEALRVRGSG